MYDNAIVAEELNPHPKFPWCGLADNEVVPGQLVEPKVLGGEVELLDVAFDSILLFREYAALLGEPDAGLLAHRVPATFKKVTTWPINHPHVVDVQDIRLVKRNDQFGVLVGAPHHGQRDLLHHRPLVEPLGSVGTAWPAPKEQQRFVPVEFEALEGLGIEFTALDQQSIDEEPAPVPPGPQHLLLALDPDFGIELHQRSPETSSGNDYLSPHVPAFRGNLGSPWAMICACRVETLP